MLTIKDYLKAGDFRSAIAKLLRLVRIEIADRNLDASLFDGLHQIGFSYDISTVSVCQITGDIKFGVAFFIDRIRTISDVLAILLHERQHLIIACCYNAAYYDNFAQDVVINIPVTRMLPGNTFFADFYTNPKHPTALLSGNVSAIAECFEVPEHRVGPWVKLKSAVINAYRGTGAVNVPEMLNFADAWYRKVVRASERSNTPKPETVDIPLLGHDSGPQNSANTTALKNSIRDDPEEEDYTQPTISFGSLRIPDHIVLTKIESKSYNITNMTPPAMDGIGQSINATVSSAMRGPDRYETFSSRAPSRISRRDLVKHCSGIPNRLWIRSEALPCRKALLLVDFSYSMAAAWPIAVSIAHDLSHYVGEMHGFGSTCAPFSWADDGISVGLNTALMGVIESIENSRYSDVIIISDFNFQPCLVSRDLTDQTVSIHQRFLNLVPDMTSLTLINMYNEGYLKEEDSKGSLLYQNLPQGCNVKHVTCPF